MKLLDRIALNRLIQTIVNLILNIVKILAKDKDIEEPITPNKRRKFPLFRKKNE